MSGTPPGWYPDAQGVMRWFDGNDWTEHTQDAVPQPPASPPPAAPPAAPPAPPSSPPTAPLASPWNTPGYESHDDVPPAPAQPSYGGQQGYPPAGPPSYAPTYGSPTPPGPQRRTGLIAGLAALAVLLVAGVVVGAVLLLGGSDDGDDKAGQDPTSTATEDSPDPAPTAEEPSISSSPVTPSDPPSSEAPVDPGTPTSGSPEEVADGFMKAILEGDCEAAQSYVSEESIAGAGGCAGAELPTTGLDSVTYDVGAADITGDTATVPVAFVLDLGDDIDMGDLGDIPGLVMSLERSGDRWLVTNLVPE